MSPEDYKYLVAVGNGATLTIAHFWRNISILSITALILCVLFTLHFVYLNEQYKHTQLEEYELYFIPHNTHGVLGSMLFIIGIYIEPLYSISGALILGIGLIILSCAIYSTQSGKYGYREGKNSVAKYSLLIGSLCFVPIPFVLLYAPRNLITLSVSVLIGGILVSYGVHSIFLNKMKKLSDSKKSGYSKGQNLKTKYCSLLIILNILAIFFFPLMPAKYRFGLSFIELLWPLALLLILYYILVHIDENEEKSNIS